MLVYPRVPSGNPTYVAYRWPDKLRLFDLFGLYKKLLVIWVYPPVIKPDLLENPPFSSMILPAVKLALYQM
jgi:hypothetical protein